MIMSAWSRIFTNLHLISMPFAYLSFNTLKNKHVIIITDCGSLGFIMVIKFLSWNSRTKPSLFFIIYQHCVHVIHQRCENYHQQQMGIDQKRKQVKSILRHLLAEETMNNISSANFTLDSDIWQPNTKFCCRMQTCGY